MTAELMKEVLTLKFLSPGFLQETKRNSNLDQFKPTPVDKGKELVYIS